MVTYYKFHTLKCQVGIAVPNSIHLADNIIRKMLYYP